MQPAEDDLRQAAELLDRAKSVAILVGTGARGAEAELLALADRLQAPLIHTFRAKDMLTHDQPRWVGGVGLIGGRPGVDAAAHADLLLIVGSDYPYKEFLPSHGRVIQIDNRAVALGRRTSVALGIVGSARPALARLVELTAPKADTAFSTAPGAPSSNGRRSSRNSPTSAATPTSSARKPWRASSATWPSRARPLSSTPAT